MQMSLYMKRWIIGKNPTIMEIKLQLVFKIIIMLEDANAFVLSYEIRFKN